MPTMVNPRVTQTSTKTSRPSCPVRLIAILCLSLIVLVGLAILITWLVIRPKKVQFTIDEGWIRDYNLTNNKLNSTFNFVIRAYNPNNKAKIYYNSMKVEVAYRGHLVASDTIQAFVQPRKNVTRVMFHSAVKNVALPGKAVHDLKAERTGGEVDLDISLRGKIRYKVGVWKSRRHKLKVLCSPVVVNFSDDKKSQVRECEVDM